MTSTGTTTDEARAAHRHEHLVAFAQDVAAQSLGTVTGAGLLYLSASWLGMLSPPPALVVVAILVAAVLPLLAVLVPRRHHGHRRGR